MERPEKEKKFLKGAIKEGSHKVGTVKCSVKITIIYLELVKEKKDKTMKSRQTSKCLQSLSLGDVITGDFSLLFYVYLYIYAIITDFVIIKICLFKNQRKVS